MSHFSVLVITDHKPTDESLTRVMAPYHEFECTGDANEFVQSVDILPEARRAFEESTRHWMKGPDGELCSRYDDMFYRDPTPDESEKIGIMAGAGAGHGMSWTSRDWGDGKGYRTKVCFVPEGYEEVELKRSETSSFKDFVVEDYGYNEVKEGEEPDIHDTHKFGWYRTDSEGNVTELIRRTNPDAKWDWWEVGGRWSGFLTPKEDASDSEKGVPGLGGSQADPQGRDIIRKGDVDFEAMREKARYEAGVTYRRVRAVVDPHLDGFVPWEKCVGMYPDDIDSARKFYHAQPAVRALRDYRDLIWYSVEEFLVDFDKYVEMKALSSTTTFACLKDGKWVERGSMGWWGIVTDEADKGDWAESFNKMLNDIPDDSWLTVIDCHI